MGEEKTVGRRREQSRFPLRALGREWRQNRRLRHGGRLGARLVLAFLLARGRMLGGMAPFGVAFVAASGGGAEGFAALLGALGGYLTFAEVEEGLRLAAGCVLVFALAVAVGEGKPAGKKHFMPLCAGALDALTGLVTHAAGAVTARQAAALTGEVAFCVLGVYVFRGAFSLLERGEFLPRSRLRRLEGVAAVLCALTALTGIRVLGRVSLGLSCAVAAVMACAVAGGVYPGVAAGLMLGLAVDLAGGTSGFYALAFALGGLIAGALKNRPRAVAAMGFALGWGGIWLWQWQRGAAFALWELALGTAALMLLPRGWLGWLEDLLAPSVSANPWAGDTAQRTLRRMAKAFSTVFSAVKRAFPPGGEAPGEPEDVVEQTARRVCAGCGMREMCWQRGYQDTHDLLNQALTEIRATQRVEAGAFPRRFRDKCCRFSSFLTAMEQEWREYLLLRRVDRRLEEGRAAVRAEYGALAGALEEAAQALAAPETTDDARSRKLSRFLAGREMRCRGRVSRDSAGTVWVRLRGPDAGELAGDVGRESLCAVLDMPLVEVSAGEEEVLYRRMEPLRVTAALAAKPREPGTVNGDGGVWFQDEKGRFRAILCDGMGSGPAAGEDSRVTLDILEQLLRAGVTEENALGTLDRAMALRGEGEGGFAALDLLTVDLLSGEASLYKLGAPGSYLKRGGTVVKLAAQGLPAGLEPEKRRLKKLSFRVSPGDELVLVTDGVLTGAEDEAWLKAALAEFDSDSAEEFARRVVDHSAGADDRTALALRVGLNGPAA